MSLRNISADEENLMPATNHVCQNCRYWVLEPESTEHRHCDFIWTIQGERVAATTGCSIAVTVLDDSGLDVFLRTGPNFSCPNFSDKG